MIVVCKKEKETNQQVLRRFNRAILNSKILQEAREISEFAKAPNRSTIRRSALRREELRRKKQWY